MKQLIASMFALLLTSMPVYAEAVVGEAAPSFSGKDATGAVQTLSSHKGKWVVLEWFNKDCPYVKKHYSGGDMQKLQTEYTAKSVVWLSVASSAEGKQGYTNAAEALAVTKENKSGATALILDPSGAIGKAYGAKTTPHMFVINPEGVVVYAGAIDDNDSSDSSVIASSKNYVKAALDESLSGKAVSVSSTRPYGCGVKY